MGFYGEIITKDIRIAHDIIKTFKYYRYNNI